MRKGRQGKSWFVFWGFVVLLTLLLAAAVQGDIPGPYLPGEVLVKFRPGAAKADVEAVKARHGAKEIGSIDRLKVKVLKVRTAAVEDAVRRLNAEPGVLYAEPNYIVQALAVAPDDPYFGGSYVGAFESGSQWGPQQVYAPEAWSLSTGSASIIIAVNDTGVDASHPDLAGKLVAGTSYISGESELADGYGHGTHVAGIAAAATNNSAGIAGLGWDCKIMPVKVLDDTGSGSVSSVANGVIWAADHGAWVINMSYGGNSYSQTEQEALNHAYNQGCVLVAAAGNGGNRLINYPAGSNYVLGVGATTQTDALASFSNFNRSVTVAAPGVSILSLLPVGESYLSRVYGYNTSYDFLDGTSMSAPHVAGAAALYLSYAGPASPLAVRQALERSADAAGGYTGWNPYFGYGRLNLYRALPGAFGANRDTAGGIVGQITSQGVAANAQVSLYRNGVLVARQKTGRPGLYRFSNLAAGGGYSVTASAKSGRRSAAATVSGVSVPAGADAQVDIAL